MHATPATRRSMENLIRIRQRFEPFKIQDTAERTRMEMEVFKPRIRPGMRVGIAVGSRGIASLSLIVRAMVDALMSFGARPFIIPAMGSHGGANPEGQTRILASYGVDSSTMGIPIQPGMEVIQTGVTRLGVPVFCAEAAMKAEAVLMVNRIKPHTDFQGMIGSGLMKMMVVGLGKHRGAASFHEGSSRCGHEEMILEGAEINAQAAPIMGGLALIESARHEIGHIEAVPTEDLKSREPQLKSLADRHLAKLPFEEVDLLVLDEIGKDISGTGMDTNVTGRGVQGYSSHLRNESNRSPFIRRIFVRDLSPGSHGNAIGIGNADFTTTRLVEAMDFAASAVNAQTSLTPQSVKIPIHFPTDLEVLDYAFKTLAKPLESVTLARIKNTLEVEWIQVTPNLRSAAAAGRELEDFGPVPRPVWDESGNLSPM